MTKKITQKEIMNNLEKETDKIFESFFGFKPDDDLDTVIKKLTTEENKNKGF
jgi:hypothetical protein